MVVDVLGIRLEDVVVCEAGRELGLDPIDPYGLEGKVHHCACGILGESLAHADPYLPARCCLAFHQVAFSEFLGESESHSSWRFSVFG